MHPASPDAFVPLHPDSLRRGSAAPNPLSAFPPRMTSEGSAAGDSTHPRRHYRSTLSFPLRTPPGKRPPAIPDLQRPRAELCSATVSAAPFLRLRESSNDGYSEPACSSSVFPERR